MSEEIQKRKLLQTYQALSLVDNKLVIVFEFNLNPRITAVTFVTPVNFRLFTLLAGSPNQWTKSTQKIQRIFFLVNFVYA